MLNSAEIAKIVDRMGDIKRQIAELNSESDTLEAMLLKQFEADVEDTKYKSVKYRGTVMSLPKKPHINCRRIQKGCWLLFTKRILSVERQWRKLSVKSQLTVKPLKHF